MGKKRQSIPKLQSIHTLLMILFTLGYLLASHLSTINSLKAAIAGKAERTELEGMDKKLTRIEVKLEEAVLARAEFERLRDKIERSMMEIRFKLEEQDGETRQDGR